MCDILFIAETWRQDREGVVELAMEGPIEVRKRLHKALLKANAVKVVDVFKSWDVDGDSDGVISKRDFRRALVPLLKIAAGPEAVCGLEPAKKEKVETPKPGSVEVEDVAASSGVPRSRSRS